MAFDPDAYLATPSAPSGFDPDAYLADGIVDDDKPKPGRAESFGRGILQGATFGFADEIAGGLESALTDKTYEQARNESRSNFKAAKDENPWSYGVGDVGAGIATSFIPGVGIAKGASLGATAGKAALLGGVSGLGGSESESVGGQVADAVGSAAVAGGATGVLGGLVRGSPKRVVNAMMDDISDGAKAVTRDRLSGKIHADGTLARRDDVIATIREHADIKKAGNNTSKLMPAIDKAMTTVGGNLDEMYARAGKATPGVSVPEIVKRVSAIADDLATDPGQGIDMARAIRGKLADITEVWGGKSHVSAQDVRKLASGIAETAFRGSPNVTPKTGAAAGQRVWGELKDLIAENIDESAKALGTGGAAELATLNKKMSTLMNMSAAVRERATREASGSTRLKDRIGGGLDIGLALMDPSTFVAKKAFDYVGKPGLRAADAVLANLVQAARAGSTKAQIAQRAVEMGLAPTVQQALGHWMVQKVFGSFGAAEEPTP